MNTAIKLGLIVSIATAAVACNKADATSSEGSKPGKAAFVQKGIKPGKVAVGYLQDEKDPLQCGVVTDAPEGKDKFTKNGPELAKMMKAKLVTACPTDSVVGTCDVGMGLLVNYSGPTWTTQSAKTDCTSKPRQTWIE
ncbi:hypothetical protein AKJ09_00466 [Labilithrix luteola]|uniref:Lipoprotein n=1 Tax=Labilithrix luteola TaxID=1391654 RepID=A0A0K1PJW5_9BACT|nr:hypothetical protein [Labilithrix luteola]AKU93802.1 hypothetical protein AKJ09_00466 [Labilithrix luteola]